MTANLGLRETPTASAPPQKPGRPPNREVEDEMICPPSAPDGPPRPATEPRDGHKPASP